MRKGAKGAAHAEEGSAAGAGGGVGAVGAAGGTPPPRLGTGAGAGAAEWGGVERPAHYRRRVPLLGLGLVPQASATRLAAAAH